MDNVFLNFYNLIEGKYTGKKLTGVSSKSVNDYKKMVKNAGLNDGSDIKKGDLEMANNIVKKEYNILYDRLIEIMQKFNSDKDYRVLLSDLQKIQVFWNKNANIDKVIKSSHAPIRHAIYKELMKVNKSLPYTVNQFGFPIYPFHLIPVFTLKDILNTSGNIFNNVNEGEIQRIYDMLSGKLNLTPDQKSYLSKTKSGVSSEETSEDSSPPDIFKAD